MTVYQPLQDYLAQKSDPAIVMDYAEIEKLLGRRLPPTAYGANKRQWWANTETHSQALAWLRANRKAKLDVTRDEVTFIRQPGINQTERQRSGAPLLQGLSAAARRMLEDVAEDRNIPVETAAADFLNEIARRRRAATLEWFEGKSSFSERSSAELVREDRDAR